MIEDIKDYLDDVKFPVYKNEEHKLKLRKILEKKINQWEGPSPLFLKNNLAAIALSAATLFIILIFFLVFYFVSAPSELKTTITYFEGNVLVEKSGELGSTKIDKFYQIEAGDKFIIKENSKVSLLFANKTEISLEPNTVFGFISLKKAGTQIELETYLEQGKAGFHAQDSTLFVETNFALVSLKNGKTTIEINTEKDIKIEFSRGEIEIWKKFEIPDNGIKLAQIDSELYQEVLSYFREKNKIVLEDGEVYNISENDWETINAELARIFNDIYKENIPTPQNKEESIEKQKDNPSDNQLSLLQNSVTNPDNNIQNQKNPEQTDKESLSIHDPEENDQLEGKTINDPLGDTSPGFIDIVNVTVEQKTDTTLFISFKTADPIPREPDENYGNILYKIWVDADPQINTSHGGGAAEYVICMGYQTYPDRMWGGSIYDCINSQGGINPFPIELANSEINATIDLQSIGYPNSFHFSFESFTDLEGHDGDSNAQMSEIDLSYD